MIATDFSAAAESVYPYAIKLAQRLKLPALLVNVDEASYWGIDASSQREHFKSHQQSSLQRAIALFEEAGVH
ncbi:MAG: hypothetical protein KC492_28220, partial [Myxococcales bacterium]|nr:hypothetical protein [Myxococcales bacterium]